MSSQRARGQRTKIHTEAVMILSEEQQADAKRKALFMNEYALRKLVENLFDTLECYRASYRGTEAYVKGRQS